MTPTISQVMKCYQVVAHTERMKTGRPGDNTEKRLLDNRPIFERVTGDCAVETCIYLTQRYFAFATWSFGVLGILSC